MVRGEVRQGEARWGEAKQVRKGLETTTEKWFVEDRGPEDRIAAREGPWRGPEHRTVKGTADGGKELRKKRPQLQVKYTGV